LRSHAREEEKNVLEAHALRSLNQRAAGVVLRLTCRLLGLASILTALVWGVHPVFAEDALTSAQSSITAVQPRPLDLVKLSVSRVLALAQPQPGGGGDGGQRRAEIRQAAEGLFDFDGMARRMLAERWEDGTPQEQKEFVRLFTDLLERSYLAMVATHPPLAVTFLDESISGSYAQVRSRLVTDRGEEMPIEYRLAESDGRWVVYDVVVSGVSVISSYRSQFNSILRRSSFAQLLDRMRGREASVARVEQGP
jgi:phospholipid transport system substrate-binding protein